MARRKRSKKKNKGEEIALVVGGVVVLAVVLFVVLGTNLLKVGNCCNSTTGAYLRTGGGLKNNVLECHTNKGKWKVGVCTKKA